MFEVLAWVLDMECSFLGTSLGLDSLELDGVLQLQPMLRMSWRRYRTH